MSNSDNTPWSAALIRQKFLQFFTDRQHTQIASGSLVPHNDDSLMFTNAGMVQFKDVFTGKETRDYQRATTTQKCVRAGGKHNDLENVGFTPRHHTFFEMLGNFSFGDYFKEDAIKYAWKLITEEYGLSPDRLCVTVFEGEEGIPADDEAATIWKDVGVPANRIFRLGKADNYWQMGDTGPQGPCSEIHYLMDPNIENALSAKRVEDSDGWMEIWNLVFMQFVRNEKGGPLNPLAKPSIDTGAGLERLAVVLQNKSSNYEIDLFQNLIANIADNVGKNYGKDDRDDVSMRVIADHARATAFLVADGVQPSNEGRGYVLRRIMRRAIRYGHQMGFKDLFFYKPCLDVISIMEDIFPELTRSKDLIQKVAESEETSFRQTLSRGLKLLDNHFEKREDKEADLDPSFVAELYDTYGFPIDLTRVIANERDIQVDEETAHKKVKELQTGGGLQTDGGTGSSLEKIWFEIRDSIQAPAFLGYDQIELKTKVVTIVKDGALTDKLDSYEKGIVLLQQTPLYGESGGQVGDTGTITWDGGQAIVTDSQKPLPELIAHHVTIQDGPLCKNQEVTVRVETTKREATKRNHSATHLLHLALREILGPHVQQKGSLVAPDKLRFDYAHFDPLSLEQIQTIEERVNQLILNNKDTESGEYGLDEAREAGAMMLFGEKYSERVRMVRIAQDSLELCGGTHVERSGDIGLFKITAEASLAAGVRRIEAITGFKALEWAQGQELTLRRTSAALKASVEELPDRVDKMSKRIKQLEKALEEAQAQLALGGGTQSDDPVEEINGIKVMIKRADGTPKKSLRSLADKLRDKIQSGVVILAAAEGDKAAFLVAATKDVTNKVNAGQIIKAAAEAMGGSGGGRPDFAQGGGPSEAIEKGIEAARNAISG